MSDQPKEQGKDEYDFRMMLAEIADCLNLELRENGGELYQIQDCLHADYRPAIRKLVDLCKIPRPAPSEKWISVKERKPNDREYVMFFSAMITPQIRIGFYDGERWRVVPGWLSVDDVTHWQPLPPLPEGDKL